MRKGRGVRMVGGVLLGAAGFFWSIAPITAQVSHTEGQETLRRMPPMTSGWRAHLNPCVLEPKQIRGCPDYRLGVSEAERLRISGTGRVENRDDRGRIFLTLSENRLSLVLESSTGEEAWIIGWSLPGKE